MKLRTLALAAALSLFAVPALAAMQPVGAAGLWPVDTHAVITWPALSGDIVALTARGNADIACRSVTASFADGSSAEIFHGVLPPDDQFKVYLPGGVRTLRQMDFDCLSVDRGHAVIDVAADVVPGSFVPAG